MNADAILNRPREYFCSDIVERSVSKDYHIAIKEWDIVVGYTLPEAEYTYCICGQPIHRCCLISNRNTNKFLVIGNICATKYIDAPSRITLSILPELLTNCVINQWEHDFMISAARFANHSVKQRAVYKRIMDKVTKHYNITNNHI